MRFDDGRRVRILEVDRRLKSVLYKSQEPHCEREPTARFLSFGPKWGDNHLGLWSESHEPSWFDSLPDEETSTLNQG
jgi:hypothetical protein